MSGQEPPFMPFSNSNGQQQQQQQPRKRRGVPGHNSLSSSTTSSATWGKRRVNENADAGRQDYPRPWLINSQKIAMHIKPKEVKRFVHPREQRRIEFEQSRAVMTRKEFEEMYKKSNHKKRNNNTMTNGIQRRKESQHTGKVKTVGRREGALNHRHQHEQGSVSHTRFNTPPYVHQTHTLNNKKDNIYMSIVDGEQHQQESDRIYELSSPSQQQQPPQLHHQQQYISPSKHHHHHLSRTQQSPLSMMNGYTRTMQLGLGSTHRRARSEFNSSQI
eukprot:m.127117 g.127117  ORF g.127117 m.127117 type:complete len:274 (+) comp12998_c2_seq7:87-908(+)